MPRPQRRSANQDYLLYQPKSNTALTGWAVHSRCSKEERDRLVDLGLAVEEPDQFGYPRGYRLLGEQKTVANPGREILSSPTPQLMNVSEIQLIGGQAFRDSKSRTKGLPWDDVRRLTRVSKNGRALPPEDAVERAIAKLEAVTPRHLQLAAAD